MIALVALAHYRFRLGAILAFWLAYIMTRPLGASIGDLMSQKDPHYGGLGLGTTATSYIFLGLILAMVVYLTVTRRDRTQTPAAEAPERDVARRRGPAPRPRIEVSGQEA